MPRIRRIKDYEWVDKGNFHVEDSDDEGHSPDGSQPLSEAATGQSWLSNASVIASLSDDKLKSAIQYHRTIARLMEDELTGRRLGTRSQRDICPPEGFGDSGQGASNNRRRAATTNTRKARKITKLVDAIANGLDNGLSLEDIHKLLTKDKDKEHK